MGLFRRRKTPFFLIVALQFQWKAIDCLVRSLLSQMAAMFRPPWIGRKSRRIFMIGTSAIPRPIDWFAQRMGLSVPQTVHDWRRRHADFPKPIAVLTMGMVWHWPDVEAWARRTGRRS